MREAPGVMSKDGERGMVWTTNVLSTYILVSVRERDRLGYID